MDIFQAAVRAQELSRLRYPMTVVRGKAPQILKTQGLLMPCEHGHDCDLSAPVG
jgi:hypothetical protein